MLRRAETDPRLPDQPRSDNTAEKTESHPRKRYTARSRWLHMKHLGILTAKTQWRKLHTMSIYTPHTHRSGNSAVILLHEIIKYYFIIFILFLGIMNRKLLYSYLKVHYVGLHRLQLPEYTVPLECTAAIRCSPPTVLPSTNNRTLLLCFAK